MTVQVEKKNRGDKLPIDANGTVKAIQMGAYGSLIGGGLGVAAAAAAAAPAVATALPLIGGVGMAALGYWRGRDKRPGRPGVSR